MSDRIRAASAESNPERFLPTSLSPEALKKWNEAEDAIEASMNRVRRIVSRHKPPSLKEQALAKLAAMERLWEASGNEPSDLVRRALEQLDD